MIIKLLFNCCNVSCPCAFLLSEIIQWSRQFLSCFPVKTSLICCRIICLRPMCVLPAKSTDSRCMNSFTSLVILNKYQRSPNVYQQTRGIKTNIKNLLGFVQLSILGSCWQFIICLNWLHCWCSSGSLLGCIQFSRNTSTVSSVVSSHTLCIFKSIYADDSQVWPTPHTVLTLSSTYSLSGSHESC